MDQKKFNWQPVGIGATILSLIIAAWINVNIKIANIETETRLRLTEIEKDVDKNRDRYDNILNELQDIKITLENKQNRD